MELGEQVGVYLITPCLFWGVAAALFRFGCQKQHLSFFCICVCICSTLEALLGLDSVIWKSYLELRQEI